MKFYICSVVLYFITVVIAAKRVGIHYKELSPLKNLIIGLLPIVNTIFTVGQIAIILLANKEDKYNN